MLEKFVKSYSGPSQYQHTAIVRHKGIVIAFAMDAEQHIWYSILDLGSNDAGAEMAEKPKSFLDVMAGKAPRQN